MALRVLAILALSAALATPASASFHSSVIRLPKPIEKRLRTGGFWHRGCPVSRSDLRLVTASYVAWDGSDLAGQVITNKRYAHSLAHVFHRLYAIRFPIRHMQLADFYGPVSGRPKDDDATASFECRQAVPSPCTGGKGTGSWSMHAYGLAIDVNPRENPYVGCGQSRDPATKPYRDRSRHLKGMVGRRVIGAFRSIGWGWGGSWSGSTKDYMHFSSTGH